MQLTVQTITSTNSDRNGINIGRADQELSIYDTAFGNSEHGFKTAINNSIGGTVNLDGVTFGGNQTDVDNQGTLNLDGTNVINVIADNSTPKGITNVRSGETTFTAGGSVTQHNLNIGVAATTTDPASDATLNNEGTLYSDIMIV